MQKKTPNMKRHSIKHNGAMHLKGHLEESHQLAVKIQKTLTIMKNRRKHLIEQHMLKMNSLRQRFFSGCSKDYQNMEMFVDKEQELHRQQTQFIISCEYLESKLNSLESLTTFREMASVIEKEFAIECIRLRIGYPIYSHRDEIVKSVKNYQVTILLGETGSGKSTQLVQYFDGAGFSQHGLIACTQPRKIAALSVAKFVATELASTLGQDVGYRAGYKKIMSQRTRIIFMSDYEMFCEFQKDKNIAAYSCLIVDEVHERSIYTDLLLAMVKTCLGQRPEFRLIVMSATIDPGIFQSYFPYSHLIKVPGRTYPVNVTWKKTTDLESDYVNAAIKKAVEVHEKEEEGDVLVFLPTPKETEVCSSKFSTSLSHRDDYVCMSLHGRLNGDDQQRVFEPPPIGKRKIVFATNCAETSITIPNIKYVIDTGYAKEVFYEEVSKIDTLAVRLISRSSADQRKGRAGRTSEGKCFRLYTEDDYNNMRVSTKPEILRIHPAKAALKLFQMGADPSHFDFLEAPPASILSDAVDYLNNMGAISDKKITPLGNQIAELPFEPQMSLFVINAMQQDMTTEAVSIACLSSFSGNVFFRGRNEEEIENNRKQHSRFHDKHGDIISLLLVLQDYFDQNKSQKKHWCLRNAINEKTLRSVCERMNEVFDILRVKLKCKVKFPSKLSFNVDSIAKVLFKCFEVNTCIYLGHPRAGYLALNQNKQVYIHPSSSLQSLGLNPILIVFQNLLCTSRDFAFTVLSVQESWLEDLSPFLQEKVAEVEPRIVKIVVNRGLGDNFGRFLVGPKYSSLKQLENKIRQMVNDQSVFVDFSRGKSMLIVYSKESISAEVKRLVEENILCHVNKLQEEIKEIQIDSSNLAPKAVIHSGGCVKDIVMPSESRTVIVKDVPETTETETVRKKLEKFGKIVSLKTFNSVTNSNRWGSVTFNTLNAAKECIMSTSTDNDIIAVGCKSPVTNYSQCSAELTWTRRPLKGIGFIEFTNVEDFINVSHNLYNIIWRVKVDKKRENQLFLPSISKNTTEEEIKTYYTSSYTLLGDIRVSLPRKMVNYFPDEENHVKNKIDEQLKKHFHSYTIKIKNIKSKDFYYKAWVEFPSNQVIRSNSMNLLLGEYFVKFTPKFSSQIILMPKVHEILKDTLIEEIQKIKMEKGDALECEIKKLFNRNYCLILNSNSAENLNWAKKYLNEIIMGDKIEIGIIPATRVLFSKEGRIFLEDLEKRIPGSSAFLDHRHMTLMLQGTESVRTQLKSEVNNFIEQMLTTANKTFNLNDSGRPKGLKRELILRYGVDLEKLKTELNLNQIQLYRNTIEVRGSEENIQRLDSLLYEIPGLTSEADEDEIDCVACFCPVKLESFYRIESCGHPYCLECLKQMVHLALKERMFPLECSQDECNIKMCWKDFDNFCKMAVIKQKNLIDSSFSDFMNNNTDKYHYCITPDCCTVYQITTTGDPYTCYLCQVTTCTTCHIDYHFGLTCKMNESGKSADEDLQKWMKDDLANRRSCPNCNKVIEKNGGCQHVNCSCGIHICWVCMETFLSSSACYGHLSLVHLSFM